MLQCFNIIKLFPRLGKRILHVSEGNGHLSYYIRPMRKEDIAPVTEIDREAFPTQLASPNYQHELQNRLAHHIVACDEEKTVGTPDVDASSEKGSTGLTSRWRRLFNFNRSFSNELPPPSGHYVTGFAGLWVMADEAHITNIAVCEAYRRRGIGELLLISAVDLATKLKAHIITLEVRASNSSAQSLYAKYDFIQTGVRHGYYIDNREDGIVMTTNNITSDAFQARLQQLKQAHSRKWGITIYQIAR